ncbi:MAG TPA: hypothetical protein VK013_17300 [Myxococcaceae bacterium]|nr:hypothetical protein [Myxococcaceae bacterium]
MADQENWGRCRDCRYFAKGSQNAGASSSVGRCQQEDLRAFDLAVSPESGCNAWEARIAPSSEPVPPPVH